MQLFSITFVGLENSVHPLKPMSEFSSHLRMSIILHVHGVCLQVCTYMHNLHKRKSEDSRFCLLLLLALFLRQGLSLNIKLAILARLPAQPGSSWDLPVS